MRMTKTENVFHLNLVDVFLFRIKIINSCLAKTSVDVRCQFSIHHHHKRNLLSAAVLFLITSSLSLPEKISYSSSDDVVSSSTMAGFLVRAERWSSISSTAGALIRSDTRVALFHLKARRRATKWSRSERASLVSFDRIADRKSGESQLHGSQPGCSQSLSMARSKTMIAAVRLGSD